ncbi:L,D-transpeptidase [Nocardia cyriacigeorgica]|uniref:L,D-transpeptidase n=1 Tax=Nocardia cyriacigeorgica TaxID=135487 RepID=UPI002453BF99|nr:L,D-transpeptidase [Nocardia cyriacigeorgica]
MRSVVRHLFLATAIMALFMVGSGAAHTMSIDRSPPGAGVGAVASITPSDGRMVGIAHPVTIRFAADVADRATAEESVVITADQPLTGTFSWTGARQLIWTPTGYLPADTTIGVRIGEARTEFVTNAGVVADANMSAHTFTVSIGGQVVRQMPASMGKPGWETPTGTFPVLEKFRHIVFDSRTIGIPLDSPEGYLIDGEYGVRLTWGGVFVHSAPWSVDSQGYANVSHGCINLAPGDAAWYYENVGIGDPVNVFW